MDRASKVLIIILAFSLGIATMVALGALPASLQDRQYNSYRDAGSGLTAVATTGGGSSGGITTSSTATDTQVSCSTSSVALAAANTNRLEIRYINQSATPVFICSTSSTCLTTNGTSFGQNTGYTDDRYTGAYTCITESSTAIVQVREIVQ